ACILPPNLFTIPRELWLREAKATLEKTLAPARPGELCRWCDVRQFCDAYWVAPFGKGTDVELRVAGEPTATGFPGQGSDGELAVVFTADVGRVQGPFRPDERVRILNARIDKRVVELKAWTEVFHLDG